jgi:predicted heme/steroid binding protein
MRRFTREELKQYDGRKGRPAYIAYRELVYDVSESFLWQGGTHQVLHRAGRDLTEELETAPHGPDLLDRCPFAGVLSKQEE